MVMFTFVVAVVAFGTGMYVQWRYDGSLKEQLHWHEVRGEVGDLGELGNLEDQVRTLNRRIAGLLASPGAYLRARRLLGPLELEREELIKELELIETTN